MTVKNKYGKDGKLLQQTIKIDSAACRNMTNRDGSLNMVAVQHPPTELDFGTGHGQHGYFATGSERKNA